MKVVGQSLSDIGTANVCRLFEILSQSMAYGQIFNINRIKNPLLIK